MLNLIKYVNRMKKLLFLAILALFMCSCEKKGPGTGRLHFIAFMSNWSILVDIIDCDNNMLFLKDTIHDSKVYELPEGTYLVKAERKFYKDSTKVSIIEGETVEIFLDLGR